MFLRQYVNNDVNRPVTTGKFLSTPDGEGLATWAMIKAQAATMLGLQLVDTDVANIPMIESDPYGNFIPGPNGLPQYRLTTGALVEGNRTTPVPRPRERGAHRHGVPQRHRAQRRPRVGRDAQEPGRQHHGR